MAAIVQQGPLQGMDKFERRVSGSFLPNNVSPPIESKIPVNYIWNVARTGVGAYQVTILLTGGFTKPLVAAVQNPTPKNALTTLCLDPAGLVQNINLIGGPITRKANKIIFSIFAFLNSSGAAQEIIQPVTPTNQGTIVFWHIHYAEIHNPPRY